MPVCMLRNKLSKLLILLLSFSRSSQGFRLFRSFRICAVDFLTPPCKSERIYCKQLVLTMTSSSTTNYVSSSAYDEITRQSFQGKAVLLTGATGGLGAALALHFTLCGVSTLLLSARRQEGLQAVSQDCRRINPSLSVHTLPCDLSNPESVAELARRAIEIAPVIDVLVNNGGVSSRSRFLDTSAEVDRQVMEINFFSGAKLAKAVVPGMVSRGSGRIVWISSVQGLVGIPNRSSYAASKFAVQGYCESIRAELASSGVTVHCVSPGYIRTNLSTSALTGDGQSYGKTDPTTAAGADPAEVAATILRKVSRDESDFVVAATWSATAAVWLRLLCPGLLRYSLVKRYEKSQKEKND